MLALPRAVLAQPAPYHRYRTLDTPHFRVHAAEGLEREGRVAAAAAERAYALLSRELVRPRGIIDIVVSDDADYANGNATPWPTNRINIFAAPPIENEGLRFNDDWIEVVVTHELTHVFHLDRARGIWGGLQHVFGRAPFLFPNLYGPSWLTEGLAVYYESRLTEGGRLHEQNNRLIARAAAREGRLPRLDQLSLAAPGFPGGEGAYGYGALFLEYLSQTRGDSAVGRFVERQSAQLIPLWLNRSSRQSFGVSFGEAFEAWRDSVVRHADSVIAPLPGWRELTGRSLYAANPRWLDDSTIVYSGTDGRSVNAAFALSLDGTRRRIGRRDGQSANVPLADGSLLYSALDFTSRSIVRSDLYRQWPDGRVARLTVGARLLQADARADGTIVAVRLEPARSSLVLLDSAGRPGRVLRAAGPDEAWSEPRWSKDGRIIAAVHRRHGGEFSLDVIDIETDVASVLDRGRYVISSPTWSGAGLYYTTEAAGAPRLSYVVPPRRQGVVVWPSGPGLFGPEAAPRANRIVGNALRFDGYHLGIAPIAEYAMPVSMPVVAPTPVDTQRLASGTYGGYSAWRSLLPRYWYPVVETGGGFGNKYGASTTGADVLGRHYYSGYAAFSTSGDAFVGALFYRYAGLRRPLIDVGLIQDWTDEGRIFDQNGANVGTLLERTQDVSLAATFVRPRARTYSTTSAGLGVERRRFATEPASLLPLLDTTFSRDYTYPRAFVAATWANVQRPALSISLEDGVSLAFTARERLRADAPRRTASTSVVATAAGYKSLDLPGFAHHVVALRVAGGWADRRTANELEVGGTSGGTVEIVPSFTVGEGRRSFGVRGFAGGSIFGTRAAAASLEYRAPLALGGRGLGLLPFFFDRSSLTAFVDAGTAGCVADPLYPFICSPPPLIGRTIASTGLELGISAAILEWDAPQALRIGFAVPVAGRELTGARAVSGYVAFGLSY